MTLDLETGTPDVLEKQLESYEEVYSYSQLDTYQRCKRKNKYGYELRLGEPAPAVAADIGTVMHGGLATLYKTGDVDESVATIRTMYNKLFAWTEQAGYVMPKQYVLDHLLRVFLKYGMDIYRFESMVPISPAFVEVGFIVTVDDPTGKGRPPARLYGRIDWIGRNEHDRHVAPIDTKTTKSWGQDFTAKFDPDFQGDMYTFVVKRLLPNEHVTGFYINGILLQVTKIEFNRVFIPRQQRTLDEWLSETYEWIEELRASRRNNFWPKSTNQCTAFGECGFRRICTSHELQAVIDSFPRRSARGFHFTSEV